jgi:hypothetical protein
VAFILYTRRPRVIKSSISSFSAQRSQEERGQHFF